MTARREQLTATQLQALLPAEDRRDVWILGPPASGRTTTLLHAALHTMAARRIAAQQVVLLIPGNSPWAQARRTLETHRAFLGVQIMSPERLARLLDPDWTDLLPPLPWGSWLRAYSTPLNEARLRESAKRLSRYAARDGGLLAKLADAFPLVLIDNFQRFSQLERSFITKLQGTERGSRGPTLLLASGTEEKAHLAREAAPHLTVELTHRMNRRQILGLLEGVERAALRPGTSPPAPLMPARGLGGKVRVRTCGAAALREDRGAPPESGPFSPATLEELRGHLHAALSKAWDEGRDVTVMASPALTGAVNTELKGLWEVERIPRTNEAPLPLLAALRYKVGLSRPGGGHPLYEVLDGDGRWVTKEERGQADRAWAVGRRLSNAALHFDLEERLGRACSTAEVCAVVGKQPIEPLDDDPVRALETLLARRAEPRRILALDSKAVNASHSMIYVCSERVTTTEFRRVLEHTLDDLTLILVSSRRCHLQDSGGVAVKEVMADAQANAWPEDELTGRCMIDADRLKELMEHAATGPYLKHHAPRCTDEETLAMWIKTAPHCVPAEWETVREPARLWHTEVRLQEEQKAL